MARSLFVSEFVDYLPAIVRFVRGIEFSEFCARNPAPGAGKHDASAAGNQFVSGAI